MNPYYIKKILVPVDLSEPSLNALHTAAYLAQKHKAVLLILNVIEPLFEIYEHGIDYSLLNHANENVLTALTGSFHHTHDLKSLLFQKRGHLVETIISTTISEQVDLIVMGTHGASGIREAFIGTNAYNVIKYSVCPVLTIPPKRQFTSFKKALFPIRPVTGALLPYDIACHFLSPGSTLDVLGVSYLKMERELGVLDKIANEIKERFEIDKIKVKMSWGSGTSISDDVLRCAQLNNSELIILTSILDAVSKPNFIGPYSQKLINNSKLPVLSIKKIGFPAFA